MTFPTCVVAADVEKRITTGYPPEFAARVAGRSKQALGEAFGLRHFGVNRTTLAPGSQSSVRHRHSMQDEFVYMLEGELVLVHDDGEAMLRPGMCAGFPHGGSAHHLVNRSASDAVYLEIGDRLPGDEAGYPDDDLRAVRDGDGWRYTRKNGDPF